MTLPETPNRICDDLGQPLFGRYRGIIPDGSLTHLSPTHQRHGLMRIRTEKRWQYLCLHDSKWIAGLALVKLGYAGAAFVYLFDRESQTFLFDESLLLPPGLVRVGERPGVGSQSALKIPGLRCSVIHPNGLGRYEVRLRMTKHNRVFDLAGFLRWPEEPDGLSAICPVSGIGSVNLTVKQVALPTRGRLLIDEESFELGTDCYGIMDYSHGYLDRTTAWMWVCAGGYQEGIRVGFNLVAGFNDDIENAIWIDNELVGVSKVHIRREPKTDGRWQIKSEDGRVDVTFVPEGVRTQQQDIGPLSSHYTQPVGTFQGSIATDKGKLSIQNLTGVAEEHYSRW